MTTKKATKKPEKIKAGSYGDFFAILKPCPHEDCRSFSPVRYEISGENDAAAPCHRCCHFVMVDLYRPKGGDK